MNSLLPVIISLFFAFLIVFGPEHFDLKQRYYTEADIYNVSNFLLDKELQREYPPFQYPINIINRKRFCTRLTRIYNFDDGELMCGTTSLEFWRNPYHHPLN